ncbi:MAG: helix-turn-helix transcriptional regulator [Lachnospiraceae bacterium]|nr:helix-turn-helix transcriptional regulator [Lachnospiraceae bacterium]
MSKPKYTTMDMLMTGQLIKRLVSERGYSVSEIQEKLGLSCPQPIYRWYKGQNLPSVDNLYILSSMLGLHMEDFLIQSDEALYFVEQRENKYIVKRLPVYVSKIRAIA